MRFLYSSNQIRGTHYYLKQYNDDYFQLLCVKSQREKGFESCNYSNVKKTDDDEIERISLSRTKRNIKELALCNNFQHFSTITINSKNCDRYSLIECQKLLRCNLKKIKRSNKQFSYLFITEKHKDGAFHFHGLVRNLDLYINNNGYYSNSILDNIGYNSFSPIKDYNKCCNYIMKYITKDCIRNEHNQIYISSRGLKKADSYSIQPIDIDWSYENDFVKIKEFSSNELSRYDIFKILGLYNPTNFKNIKNF